ncbi:hypothetical protein PICSAR64_01315 [Mycobacterium avium subsp. paratuberculosis]|nr:hypothetical protein PICSAR64_01315 [Mycobacterium avium subsp. paratuberculosis]
MEAAVHREVGSVVVFGPAADPAAEVVLTFDDLDGDAALGEPGGGGQARDPTAHHRHPWAGRQRTGIRQSGWRRQYPTAAVGGTRGHEGASARKVCTMPASQPGMVSLWTAVKPASASRARNRVAPSNASTLRHR